MLSSSGTLPDLWTWRWSLALLRYSQTAPPCFESLKVSSSPALFHVRNWSPTDMPIDDGSVTPGKQRKLWGLVKVMATKTGSAHEKVIFPWDRWKRGEVKTEELLQPKRETRCAWMWIHFRAAWRRPDAEIWSASLLKELELITIMITARLRISTGRPNWRHQCHQQLCKVREEAWGGRKGERRGKRRRESKK